MPRAPESGATVNEWLAYLEALHPKDIDLGLDRVLLVLRRLFPRHPGARIVTIGGTNGKGTTVAALERLLLSRGRSVGAYTSPHLQVYNERVRLNGLDIDDASLVDAFERVEAARRDVSLTYFEFGTLAAFVAFEKAGVEDWLLEVGLGGRLDAVNVLDADLAIITSVDLDHTAWLGDDREQIGFEKAGILRFGQDAIYAESNPPRSVLQQAAAQKVRFRRLGEDYRIDRNTDGRACVVTDDWRVTLPEGGLPVGSLAAAVQGFRILEPDVGEEAIAQALEQVAVPGRFETLRSSPRVIVDVGHNPHAARWLREQIAKLGVSGQVRAVYACLEDKDSAGVVSAVSSVIGTWYLAPLTVPRGLDLPGLERRLEAVLAGHDRVRGCPSVSAAIDAAIADADPADVVVVFGSFFTVAEARQHLG
ncbi:bifunctional tetrahydrofolate synthase/dihydrofolate synthase [Marinobacter sp. JSM 1782161]|uniref:bifunctional tetrahydrofolate synthase/dihydrofolate synthase n=1 Tax=Marinobacter sp. JSM 1782161 TaxID=2685906 RepID=UPI00140314F2|nr:bifunctional tetrahydrofolate synthase/dihydrofolate synthase [Marinobacter sp. JSM 1782161]